ncbi:MAG: hypothetical protein IIZ78_03400 [Clostridiales bacterium]|nr:hypothetical protein [Clostridiales bacterium]
MKLEEFIEWWFRGTVDDFIKDIEETIKDDREEELSWIVTDATGKDVDPEDMITLVKSNLKTKIKVEFGPGNKLAEYEAHFDINGIHFEVWCMTMYPY